MSQKTIFGYLTATVFFQLTLCTPKSFQKLEIRFLSLRELKTKSSIIRIFEPCCNPKRLATEQPVDVVAGLNHPFSASNHVSFQTCSVGACRQQHVEYWH